jgi:kynurenine formamidase
VVTDFQRRYSDEEVVELTARLSNWGRWGADDERGAINLITEENVRRAGAAARRGRVISLAHDISLARASNNPRPAVHVMQYNGPERSGCSDFIGIACHGFAVTHLDALCHVFTENKIYNGYHVDEVISFGGAQRCGIGVLGSGIVTRAVLLDVARTQSRSWLDAGEYIHGEDLDAAEKFAGVTVSPGDAVIVRVGQMPRMAAAGLEKPGTPGFVRAGLDADCLVWLRGRDVAIYGGDCMDRMPSGYPSIAMPLHRIGIACMGMPLIDNVAVEELGDACAELGSWEFQLMVAPLRLRRATGSAVNPIAIL